MPSVGFEPTISAGERLQTYALDRAATRTDCARCKLANKTGGGGGTGQNRLRALVIFLTKQSS